MFDPVIESPIALSLVCALLAALVVLAGYRAPYLNRRASRSTPGFVRPGHSGTALQFLGINGQIIGSRR